MKANAKLFYASEVSDDTLIGEDIWMNIKDKVCGNDIYKTEAWYSKLRKEKKELIEMLKDI